jgi:hypothetical protein
MTCQCWCLNKDLIFLRSSCPLYNLSYYRTDKFQYVCLITMVTSKCVLQFHTSFSFVYYRNILCSHCTIVIYEILIYKLYLQKWLFFFCVQLTLPSQWFVVPARLYAYQPLLQIAGHCSGYPWNCVRFRQGIERGYRSEYGLSVGEGGLLALAKRSVHLLWCGRSADCVQVFGHWAHIQRQLLGGVPQVSSGVKKDDVVLLLTFSYSEWINTYFWSIGWRYLNPKRPRFNIWVPHLAKTVMIFQAYSKFSKLK